MSTFENSGTCSSPNSEYWLCSACDGRVGANRTNGPGASGVQPRKFGSVVAVGVGLRLPEPAPLALVVLVGHSHWTEPLLNALGTFTRLASDRYWAPSAQPTSPPGSVRPDWPLNTRSAVKLWLRVSTARGSNIHRARSSGFSSPAT